MVFVTSSFIFALEKTILDVCVLLLGLKRMTIFTAVYSSIIYLTNIHLLLGETATFTVC